MSANRIEPQDWVPGLLHGERTLREVWNTLPGIAPSDISRIVRFFENPSSNWALPGAITLFRHDCLHILLGRGIRKHDEPFILGFTMGQSDGVNNHMTKLLKSIIWVCRPFSKNKNKILRNWQITLYEFIAKYFYPEGYRLDNNDIVVFNLGLGFGAHITAKNIETFPFESYFDTTIGEIRKTLGISVLQLETLNRTMQMYVPGEESNRLDTNSEIDHSHITEE